MKIGYEDIGESTLKFVGFFEDMADYVEFYSGIKSYAIVAIVFNIQRKEIYIYIYIERHNININAHKGICGIKNKQIRFEDDINV